MSDMDARQERREQKLRKKRYKILQHGRGLIKIYRDAVVKRLKRRGGEGVVRLKLLSLKV